MAHNVGEELVGAYLQHVEGYEFVAFNLHTLNTQGEIDVVGLNMKSRTVYLCEVAIHLETGLQYVTDRQPDNVSRLVGKFEKDIEYARKYFKGYKKVFMLWSPIVRDTRLGSKHNQMRDIAEIKMAVKKRGIDLRVFVNEEFQWAILRLKEIALEESKELKSSVMRLFQIEAKLNDHLTRRARGHSRERRSAHAG